MKHLVAFSRSLQNLQVEATRARDELVSFLMVQRSKLKPLIFSPIKCLTRNQVALEMSNMHLAGKGGGMRVPYVVRALQVKVRDAAMMRAANANNRSGIHAFAARKHQRCALCTHLVIALTATAGRIGSREFETKIRNCKSQAILFN